MKRQMDGRIGLAALGLAALSPLALGQTVPPGGPNVNLVKNAGFEYKHASGPDGDVPLYWRKAPFAGGFGSFAIETSAFKHGMNALAITDASAVAAWGLESDLIPVEPGYVYTLRAWYESGNGSDNVLSLRWYDAAEGYLAEATVGSSASAWTLLRVTDTAPVAAAFARVLLHSGAADMGTGRFDSISLVLADERVGDGGFRHAIPRQLPEHWSIQASHAGSIQEARIDGLRWIDVVQQPNGGAPDSGGNMVLRLHDASASESCGVSYRVPVTPDTPYELSVRARKPDGSGRASVQLAFYDADDAELSSHSRSTASRTFKGLSVRVKADLGAVYARVVCSSGAQATGDSRFDNVRFHEDYTRLYASPDGDGALDGSSAADAADYDAAAFWADVHTAAFDHPVRVVLLAGDYTDFTEILGVGNALHHVLVEGETPYAANLAGSTSDYDYVLVHGSQNLTFRHLHFTSDNVELAEYQLRIGTFGKDTYDIRVQGCSWVNITNMHAGNTGAHRPGTHDITWEYCNWVRVGNDAPDHCIYNSWGAYDLWIHDNYMQDCGGYYLKCRDECHDVLIEDNTFVCTGTVGLVPNLYLIYFSALNILGYDELLPYDITIRSNSFTYDDPGAPGWENPFVIKMEGDEPTEHPGYYLISSADGAYISDAANSAADRNAKIEEKCHIDIMGGAYLVYGNTYENCDESLFLLWRKDPPPGDYWEGFADIDALLGL